MKKSLALLLAVSGFTAALYATPVQAHQDGCHRWHSCPSDHGTYVCGDTGYSSECGGGTTDYSAPTDNTDTASDPPRDYAAEAAQAEADRAAAGEQAAADAQPINAEDTTPTASPASTPADNSGSNDNSGLITLGVLGAAGGAYALYDKFKK